MKLSKSEAGKLGAIRSTELAAEAKAKRITEYNLAPNFCSHCKESLSYDIRKNKYCSRSCAAKVNNVVSPKRVFSGIIVLCLECSNPTPNPHFCSRSCSTKYRNKQTEIKVLAGKASHGQVKKYLIRTYGNKCSSCDDTHKRGIPLVMELEHINGNSTDNSLSNCELLCPSCHSVTPTYKAKNKGNGRAARRQRYQDGKSY